MVKYKYQKWILIVGLILTLLVIFLPVIYTRFYHNITSVPEAVSAKLDLSKTDRKKQKIFLDGQWEFYWKKFIIMDSKEELIPDFMIKVPDEWSNYKIDDERITSDGYASYRLTLENYVCKDPVTLFLPDFSGAYKVYIDGQIASESGIIAKDTDEIYTAPKSKLYPVSLSDDRSHEVVIEVATTRFSGLYMTPILSNYHKIITENNLRTTMRLILFGIALFAFINLLFIYLFSIRRKLNSFWMPVMILLILIRTMLTTEFYSFWQPVLFFGLSYEKTNFIMYLVTFVLKYLLIYLVQEQCGIDFNRREKIGFLIYYAILFLTYIAVPRNIYNQYLSVIIPMLTYMLDIYLFIKVYVNREKLIKFGLIVFLGAYLIMIGLSLDGLYINGKIYMNMSIALPTMLVITMVIMSIVYSMRIGDLYDDFTISASRLEMVQKQITVQKEYYDRLSCQMDEIRKINHDINHFIGTMGILAEEGRIDKLKEFLSEYGEKCRMEQLPLFCEHAIANSIIGYYYLQAKKYEIPFESQCMIDEKIDVADSDLCIVLGNAIDNAISACKQMNPSQIRFISITARTTNRYLLIKVCNSYNGHLELKNGQYSSTKGETSHGFGIRNIQKVVESYGGYVKFEHDKNVFTAIAALQNHI